MAAIGQAWADGAWNVLSWNTVRPAWAAGGAPPAVVAPAAPSGVRGRAPYPRRLQIMGKRYWVNSLREEKELLERLYAAEQARLERKPDAKQARVTKYKVKRVATRLKKIDEYETRQARIRQLDEELLTFFM